LDDLPSHTYGA
jgi:hypothetical protein